MKLFGLFTTVFCSNFDTNFDTKRNVIVDAEKRLDKLYEKATKCAQDPIFQTGRRMRTGTSRVLRKLAFYNRTTRQFCQNAEEAAAEMANQPNEDLTRAKQSNPCTCLTGIAKGYTKFFDRVKQLYPDLPEIKGNRQDKVARTTENFKIFLHNKFGCPN